jgi:hypothetical protein
MKTIPMGIKATGDFVRVTRNDAKVHFAMESVEERIVGDEGMHVGVPSTSAKIPARGPWMPPKRVQEQGGEGFPLTKNDDQCLVGSGDGSYRVEWPENAPQWSRITCFMMIM